MRQTEMAKGISIFDPSTNECYGLSKACAYSAVL